MRSSRRELRPRVRDDDAPAEELRGTTERLRRVDRAVDEEPRRRPVPLHEHLRAVLEREQLVAPAADRARRTARTPPRAPSPTRSPDSRTSSFEPTPSPSTTVKSRPRSPDSSSSASRSISVTPRALDEHVDLAAAGQADAPGELVGDPVGEQLRLARTRTPPARSRRRRSRRIRRRRSRTSSPTRRSPRLAPTGRGAERRVATTVATTTFSPASSQRSTSGRISFMRRASFRCRRALPPALRDFADYGRRGIGRRTAARAHARRRAAGTPDSPSAD